MVKQVLSFTLDKASEVNLDLTGKQILSMGSKSYTLGKHNIDLTRQGLNSGQYLLKM